MMILDDSGVSFLDILFVEWSFDFRGALIFWSRELRDRIEFFSLLDP